MKVNKFAVVVVLFTIILGYTSDGWSDMPCVCKPGDKTCLGPEYTYDYPEHTYEGCCRKFKHCRRADIYDCATEQQTGYIEYPETCYYTYEPENGKCLRECYTGTCKPWPYCTCEYTPIPNCPTIVELSSFGATLADHVLVKWETTSEIDSVGFHLWRSTRKSGEYVRITREIIPAHGSPTMGAVYSFSDTDVVPGKAYFYKLEDIDINGVSALHGPVEIHVKKTPLR